MSSLIEQAALRLEQLRRAGVQVPEVPEVVQAAPALRTSMPEMPVIKPTPQPEPISSSRRVEINLEMLATAGIVTPNAPRTRLADQYRVIKRPLIANATGRGAATLYPPGFVLGKAATYLLASATILNIRHFFR